MSLYTKFITQAAIAGIFIISVLSACQPNEKPVKPNAEEQDSLSQLYKRCGPAASSTPSKKLKNLTRLRKPDLYFTCDDMKQVCETNYASDRCQGMMIVASIENAFHKACRSRSNSSSCRKLSACNIKGFESPECLSAIKPYNL